MLPITIVSTISLWLDKSQEFQAQTQTNDLHLQEKATQSPSHQKQIEFEEQNNANKNR
ncbi:hypothetical protein [Helicobacter bizzozeronii]|uniref:hypothetical protein n=1 Tax=Helicobacter bizzozeronii TaxID=56877 RepID=UPI0018F7EB74|nr:hypothetical protein [Helicobacter bizzozeronii]